MRFGFKSCDLGACNDVILGNSFYVPGENMIGLGYSLEKLTEERVVYTIFIIKLRTRSDFLQLDNLLLGK